MDHELLILGAGPGGYEAAIRAAQLGLNVGPVSYTHLDVYKRQGYVLPVQYPTGVIREHMAVRQACGLFDVSHMGEVLYKGPDALANLQKLLTNDFSTMRDGKVRYSVMCNPKGGVVDDLIVYRFSQDAYWVVVNAANRHKDVNWMRENLFGDCQLTDMSDDVAQLALQGPKAEAVFAKVCDQEPPAGYYTFIPEMTVAGVKCLVSRTGYTGEDGFCLLYTSRCV